jgi:hypothetical protein
MEIKKFNNWKEVNKINEEAIPFAEFIGGAAFSAALAIMAWRMVFSGEDKETAEKAVKSMSKQEILDKAAELKSAKSKEELKTI